MPPKYAEASIIGVMDGLIVQAKDLSVSFGQTYSKINATTRNGMMTTASQRASGNTRSSRGAAPDLLTLFIEPPLHRQERHRCAVTAFAGIGGLEVVDEWRAREELPNDLADDAGAFTVDDANAWQARH